MTHEIPKELRWAFKATGTKNEHQLQQYLCERGFPVANAYPYRKGMSDGAVLNVLRAIGIAPDIRKMLRQAPKGEKYLPPSVR